MHWSGYLSGWRAVDIEIRGNIGCLTLYVLSFIMSWNEFIFVIVFGYRKAMTLPVMIAGSLSVRGLDFWKVASLSILAIIPPVILAVVFSRYLVRGLTIGSNQGISCNRRLCG